MGEPHVRATSRLLPLTQSTRDRNLGEIHGPALSENFCLNTDDDGEGQRATDRQSP